MSVTVIANFMLPTLSGPVGKSRPARLCVRAAIFMTAVCALLVLHPSAALAQQPHRILALRVDFPFESTDEPTTSGQGRFDLRSLTSARPDYRLPYDIPPHDRTHYEHHLQALARYYHTVSEGQVTIEGDVFPLDDTLAYTLPTSALTYGNGRSPEEIGRKWRQFSADAVALAEADPAGPVFSAYDSYLIIHAGLGHETGQLNDIRSVFLGKSDLNDYGGPLMVDGGTHQIEDLWILPEAVDDRGRAGLNGLMAKFFGHQLGLPGLSNFADGLPGVGGWSLMDVGANRIGFILHDDELDYVFGVVPPHPLAWTKAQLGWIEVTTVLHDTTVTILAGDRSPGNGSAARAVRVPLSPTESIWLENRQQRASTELDLPAGVEVPFAGLELGWLQPAEAQFSHQITEAESDSLAGRDAGVWLGADEYDAFIPSSGILAWHVDNAIMDRAPEGFNNDRERPGLMLIEADGYRDIGNFYFDRQDLTEGTRADAFHAGINPDGSPGISRLGAATTPDTRTHTGLASGVEIEVLSPPGDSMRVHVKFSRNTPAWPRPLAEAALVQGADLRANRQLAVIASGVRETLLFSADGTADIHMPGSFLAASTAGLFLSTTSAISAYEVDGSLRWTVPGAAARALVADGLSGTGAALVVARNTGTTVYNPDNGVVIFADDLPATAVGAADLDDDGDDDLIVVGPQGARRYEGSSSRPIGPVGEGLLPPALGDLDADGDADIVFVDRHGRLSTAEQDNDIELALGAAPTGAPSLADVDGDGTLEILILTQGALHVITANGLRAAGFPVTIPAYHEGGVFVGEPVAADIDGNGTQDLFAAATIGVYGFRTDGEQLPGFPLLTAASPTHAPLLADIDNDGAIEVLVAAADVVYSWRPSFWEEAFVKGGAPGWAQAAGSAAGLRAQAQVGDVPPVQQPGELLPAARAYCYPNPVDGATEPATIRFYLSRDADVTLRVYDAIGHEMGKIAATDLRAGAENEVSWPVDAYASGLYLCRLSAHGVDGTKGDVTLRMAVSR